jgi:TetR/AcrR family transcriptional regulator, ethionamide resistance regulator
MKPRTTARKAMLRNVPKPSPRPRKSETTREAILEAALDLVWTHPFRDLTVGKLMSRAGCSRPAFYQYFTDLHDLMDALLRGLERDIIEAATPWLRGAGDPVPRLKESLGGMVEVCAQRGPLLRAVSDAATSDARLEKSWLRFLGTFDDAVASRIEEDQASGLIPPFEARLTAVALNRMDVALLIHAFGRRPGATPLAVLQTVIRIWVSALYGAGPGSAETGLRRAS